MSLSSIRRVGVDDGFCSFVCHNLRVCLFVCFGLFWFVLVWFVCLGLFVLVV